MCQEHELHTQAGAQDPLRVQLLLATVGIEPVTRSGKDQGDTQQRGFTSKQRGESEGTVCVICACVSLLRADDWGRM